MVFDKRFIKTMGELTEIHSGLERQFYHSMDQIECEQRRLGFEVLEMRRIQELKEELNLQSLQNIHKYSVSDLTKIVEGVGSLNNSIYISRPELIYSWTLSYRPLRYRDP